MRLLIPASHELEPCCDAHRKRGAEKPFLSMLQHCVSRLREETSYCCSRTSMMYHTRGRHLPDRDGSPHSISPSLLCTMLLLFTDRRVRMTVNSANAWHTLLYSFTAYILVVLATRPLHDKADAQKTCNGMSLDLWTVHATCVTTKLVLPLEGEPWDIERNGTHV